MNEAKPRENEAPLATGGGMSGTHLSPMVESKKWYQRVWNWIKNIFK